MRVYGGPPPQTVLEQINKENGQNSKFLLTDCECFISQVPIHIFEDELVPLFEKYGPIWDLRIIMSENTGYHKGYCFLTYCDADSAKTAVENVTKNLF